MGLKTFVVAAMVLVGTAAHSPAQARWITSWTAAPLPPSAAGARGGPTPSYNDRTLRQILRLSAGGKAVRVRLTNAYGGAPLQIGAARLAIIDANGIEQPGTSRMLNFAGTRGAVIPKGAPLVSDAVKIDLPPLSRVAVSVYLPGDTGPCTCHRTGLDDTEVSPQGDHADKPFTPESRTMMRAFLAAVEVDAPDPARTVAVLGDSISDGVGSTPRANRRWPDLLAERLAAGRRGGAWGVANQGISGNRILNDGAGESALARLDRDILSLPGVSAIILFEGVNDLGIGFGRFPRPAPGTPNATAEATTDAKSMIAAYRQIIARAHALGIKVYGATIAPYKGAAYWSAEGEAARQDINRFIRTSNAFDAVLDFDAVLRDPADPASIRAGFHMGDFLHGSDAGYRALADSIDLRLFR